MKLKLRPWPIRIRNAYRLYRQYGGPWWAFRTAIEMAFCHKVGFARCTVCGYRHGPKEECDLR